MAQNAGIVSKANAEAERRKAAGANRIKSAVRARRTTA
jgi:hypothetical protein